MNNETKEQKDEIQTEGGLTDRADETLLCDVNLLIKALNTEYKLTYEKLTETSNKLKQFEICRQDGTVNYGVVESIQLDDLRTSAIRSVERMHVIGELIQFIKSDSIVKVESAN